MPDRDKKPFEGKSYTLFDESGTSDDYFRVIKRLADEWIDMHGDASTALAELKKTKKRNRFVSTVLSPALKPYTKNVKKHLWSLGPAFYKWFDPVIGTREYRYHLYMLEIEVTNRTYAEAFGKSAYKMAFFPHCLRDFRERCAAAPGDGIETCKGCRKDCFIHRGGKVLETRDIDCCIPITMDLGRLMKQAVEKYQRVGVIGIACVPELVMGMRLSRKLGVAPLGVPLDANRCARWLGNAQESSFNLEELKKI